MSSSTHELNRSSSKRPVGQRGLQAGRTAPITVCTFMSASQAVSLTCSVAPGRRRVRGWGRRGAARARATCGACYVRGVRGCVWPSLRHAFWIFQRTRARRVFPMLFNPRANPVTASYGNGPRRDHAANVRPEAHALARRAERPRPGPGRATLYIPRLEYRRAAFFQNARASPHTNVH